MKLASTHFCDSIRPALWLDRAGCAEYSANGRWCGWDGSNGSGIAPPTHMTVIQLTPMSMGCPVSLRAQHLADGGIVKTGTAIRRGWDSGFI